MLLSTDLHPEEHPYDSQQQTMELITVAQNIENVDTSTPGLTIISLIQIKLKQLFIITVRFIQIWVLHFLNLIT